MFSDGSFLPEEIISAAIRSGIDLIGISDHFFTTKIYHEFSYRQWLESFWPKYLYSLDQLKSYFSGQITVAAGIEIDSCLRRSVGSLENFPWSEINERLDYVLVEYVGESRWDGLPVAQLPEIRDFCEIPVILAHSDLDAVGQNFALPDFFAILKKNNIALEIVSGKRNRWFWDHHDVSLLQGINIALGTDTHRDIDEVGNLQQGLSFIEQHQLEEQMLFFGASPEFEDDK